MSKVIVFQGDSVTDAGRPREQAVECWFGNGYPGLIAASMLYDHPEAGLAFYNRGISGNRVVDLYGRWKIDTLNLKPDLVSILIGINDTWHEFAARNGVEPERYDFVYRQLVEWTRRVSPETKLLLMEPFCLVFNGSAPTEEWLPEIKQRQAIVRKIAKDYGLAFLPLQKAFSDAAEKSGNPAGYLRDGVHPAAAGHELIARAWIPVAEKLLKLK